mmetsp:Transcript_38146/g.81399  ORF Transcript_38146/g.81399 Transcript_38146/m.81399 type:complete len:235 (-) Transcript_38146:117-821(-)
MTFWFSLCPMKKMAYVSLLPSCQTLTAVLQKDAESSPQDLALPVSFPHSSGIRSSLSASSMTVALVGYAMGGVVRNHLLVTGSTTLSVKLPPVALRNVTRYESRGKPGSAVGRGERTMLSTVTVSRVIVTASSMSTASEPSTVRTSSSSAPSSSTPPSKATSALVLSSCPSSDETSTLSLPPSPLIMTCPATLFTVTLSFSAPRFITCMASVVSCTSMSSSPSPRWNVINSIAT